ncbi:large conductance mechanosensitive channel protein MscL [Luethyella okanaganae]|uniref:Large-conductance mechanosensitive channel n=1 Tax=Luethyella okanaganae TaxID=69372 RepID=A0ABW1VG94_9MICO
MLKGFREFIMRGNVIDLAVAVVIGAAFTGVVTALVNSIFNPLIGAIFKAESLNTAMNVPIPGTDAILSFGVVVAAIINFIIIAAVVYFVFVLPINKLKETQEARRKSGQAEEGAPVTELDLLTEIRDALVAGEGKHHA